MTALRTPPTAVVPRQRARPTSGCSCTPPWPLLYTVHTGHWQQVAPADHGGARAPAWCVGCGAPYTGPWRPITA